MSLPRQLTLVGKIAIFVRGLASRTPDPVVAYSESGTISALAWGGSCRLIADAIEQEFPTLARSNFDAMRGDLTAEVHRVYGHPLGVFYMFDETAPIEAAWQCWIAKSRHDEPQHFGAAPTGEGAMFATLDKLRGCASAVDG